MQNTIQNPPTAQTVDTTADWKTYSNAQYGFEFKYPSDWSVRDDSNGDPNPQTKFSTIRISKNLTDADVSYAEFTSSLTRDTGIENLKNPGLDISVGGIAWHTNHDMTGLGATHDSLLLNTSYQNKFYEIGLYPYEETGGSSTLNQILSTFKFTDSTADTSTWKTYANEQYGFSLNYPPNWYKLESDSHNPNLIVALSSNNPPQPTGSYSLNISTLQVKASDKFQTEYNFYSNSPFGVKVIKLDATVSGVSPVYAMQVAINNAETPPPKTALYYYFDYKNYSYKIYISVPTTDFDSEAKIVDQILATFKFNK